MAEPPREPRNRSYPTLPRWAFYVGDAVLLALVVALFLTSPTPIPAATLGWMVFCVVLGLGLLVAPDIIEYFSRMRRERNDLLDATEELFRGLRHARDQWQHQVIEESGRVDPAKLGVLLERTAMIEARLEALQQTPAPPQTEEKEIEKEEPPGEPLPETPTEPEPVAESPPEPESPAPKKARKRSATRKARKKRVSENSQNDLWPPPPGSPVEDKEVDPATVVSLIAHANLGLGNTPYVRGEGAGLSWEKGVPMRFVEIGKWEWQAPAKNGKIRIRLYKNDDIPADGDELVLPSGRTVEISPVFAEKS